MIDAESLRSSAYDRFEADTLELHALIRDGKLNSPEADALRGTLADVWEDMTPEQRRFGNAFSGDLYMVNAQVGETFEPATDEERSPRQLGVEIKAAWERRDWATAIALLRKGPSFLVPNYFAYLRARAYGELGRPAAALAFIREARRLDPDSTTYRILELESMAASGRVADAMSLAWRYAEDATEQPALVLRASGLLMLSTRDEDDATAQPLVDRLVRILRGIIDRLSQPAAGPDAIAQLATARLQLGACLEPTDPQAALAEYHSVIQSLPADLDGAILRTHLVDYVQHRFHGPSSGIIGRRPTRSDLAEILGSFRTERMTAA